QSAGKLTGTPELERVAPLRAREEWMAGSEHDGTQRHDRLVDEPRIQRLPDEITAVDVYVPLARALARQSDELFDPAAGGLDAVRRCIDRACGGDDRGAIR